MTSQNLRELTAGFSELASPLVNFLRALCAAVGCKTEQQRACYTSASLPEGTSRETFNRRCRSLAKLGKASKTGKVWRAEVAHYHEPALVRPALEDSDRELMIRAAKRGVR
jgi:hypothetical protein